MDVGHIHPILLVEDEADDASFVRRALEKARIRNPLVVCGTAAKARGVLATPNDAERPALLIIDIFLPGKETGLDFLGWLRTQQAPLGQLPAMIYSASTESAHASTAKALGSVVFLRKPATEDALANAVQALGFVIATTRAHGRLERVITPHHTARSAGR